VVEKIAALGKQFRCIAVFTLSDVIRAARRQFLDMHLDFSLSFPD
jgi:broad specificity phosphatase PhoE